MQNCKKSVSASNFALTGKNATETC